MPSIDAVAIDTLDTLQGLLKKERLQRTRKAEFLRDDWGWLKDEMTNIISTFTSLPLHVFFIVHLKTKELGKGDSAQTIVLPGLEGCIDQAIAGMVGYSLLAFRKEVIDPTGKKATHYFLRAEGDETYDFLGNRAAGRLPDVIEPDFATLMGAVTAGRQAVHTPPPVDPEQMPVFETPVQTAPVQNAPVTPAPAAPPNDDDQPVNAAAITHVGKVFEAVAQPFPEEQFSKLTLGAARDIMRMWKAVQQDVAEGKEDDPKGVMSAYLQGLGLVAEPVQSSDQPAAPPRVATVPDKDGTAVQVMAYVDGDLGRAQEVYEAELARSKPRTTLLAQLENLGVKTRAVQTHVQNEAAEEPQTAPETPVTPPPPAAETPSTEEQAISAVEEVLGGEKVSETGPHGEPLCEECGKPTDDADIANLAQSRFGRTLCVADYIAETKKPRD